MISRLTPNRIRQRFVERATAKFARHVPDFVALQKLVADNGGRFHNDHGAIRTADPAVTQLFLRAAQVLGLRRERDYRFPAKKLVSCDLQVIGEDSTEFKIFVSQVDLAAFPDDVAALIREDCAAQARAVDHGSFVALIERFEEDGGLGGADAENFVAHFVDCLMVRNGPPLRRSTLEAVARVSGEAASALALGKVEEESRRMTGLVEDLLLLARLDSGEYGFCDETGEPIGLGRLIARPTATLSLEAQQRRELKQKMFGD